MPNYWAFLADPDVYRIEDAVRDLETDTWTTRGAKVRQGDRVLIWKSLGRSRRRGIIALGEVLSDPTICREANPEHWNVPAKEEERVVFRYVRTPRLPLWMGGEATAILQDLSVSRGQGRAVFIVQPSQWEAVVRAAGGWPPESPEVQEARDVMADLAGQPCGGQGFHVDPQVRRAIEQYAMERATAYYTAQEWDVDNVSTRASYDLKCTKAGGHELHVEVKGTTSNGAEVLLTPKEVEHARHWHPNVALFIVARINAGVADGASPVLTGGNDIVFDPWNVNEGTLDALGYSYTLPLRTVP